MTRKIFLLITAGITFFSAGNAPARTPEENADTLAAEGPARFGFEMGVELLSSYVSRGSYQAGASFQPSLRVSWGGLFIGVWGSTDFAGTQMREVNLSFGCRKGRFEAAVIDYYIAPHPEAEGRFFDFGHRSAHTFEASLSWTVSERVPIGIWWGTMFAGAENGRGIHAVVHRKLFQYKRVRRNERLSACRQDVDFPSETAPRTAGPRHLQPLPGTIQLRGRRPFPPVRQEASGPDV